MRRCGAALVGLILLSSFGSARADVPPTNAEGCSSKKVGEACLTDDRKDGACRQGSESRRNHATGDVSTRTFLYCHAGGKVTVGSKPKKRGFCALSSATALEHGGFVSILALLGVLALLRRKGRR